jgi:hypothetical protein
MARIRRGHHHQLDARVFQQVVDRRQNLCMGKRRGSPRAITLGPASLHDGGKLQALNRLNHVRVKGPSRESKANQANLDAFHES